MENQEEKSKIVTGRFSGKVKSWHYSSAKTDGMFKFVFDIECVSGPNTGRVFTFRCGGTTASKTYLLKVLKTMGWDGKEMYPGYIFQNEFEIVLEEKFYDHKDDDGNLVMDEATGKPKQRRFVELTFVNDLNGTREDKYRVPEEQLPQANIDMCMFLGIQPTDPSKWKTGASAAQSGPQQRALPRTGGVPKSNGASANTGLVGSDEDIPF
jgi:hypothetical protein